jgi:hypothetical protein
MSDIKPYSARPWRLDGDKVLAADGEIVVDLVGVRPGDAQVLALALDLLDAVEPFAQLAKHQGKVVQMSGALPATHRPLFLDAFQKALEAHQAATKEM